MGVKFSGYKNQKNPFVILGGNVKDIDESSEIESSLISLKMAFKRVLGVYEHINGTIIKEKSFVVPFKTYNEYLSLHGLAMHFNQESILIVDEDRQATLEFIHRQNDISLGKFTPLTEREFKLLDEKFKKSYTFDGDYYYVTIKE